MEDAQLRPFNPSRNRASTLGPGVYEREFSRVRQLPYHEKEHHIRSAHIAGAIVTSIIVIVIVMIIGTSKGKSGSLFNNPSMAPIEGLIMDAEKDLTGAVSSVFGGVTGGISGVTHGISNVGNDVKHLF